MVAWYFWAALALSAGVSYVQTKKAQKEAKKMADAMAGLLITQDSSIESVPVIYGERRVGGHRVFIESSTDEKHKTLYMAIVLSEGEVEDINLATLRIDDKPIQEFAALYSDFGSLVYDPTLQVWAYQIGTGSNVKLKIEAWRGKPDQPASQVLTAAPSWTNNHKLSGLAYLAIRMDWSDEAFSGVPDINVVVKGKKVYDPRTSSTAYSDNAALCMLDYMKSNIYGKGIPDDSFNEAAFIQAANDIDNFTITPYVGGPTGERLFKLNAVLDTKEEIFRNIERLLLSCRGFLPYSNGEYALKIDQSASSVMTINEDMIIGGIGINGGDKKDIFNIVEVKFPNKATDYQPDSAIWPDPQSTNSTSFGITEAALYAQFVAEDNGYELRDEVDLDYVTDYYQARDMARILCLRSRQPITVSIECTTDVIDLVVGDVVTIEHPTPGWNTGSGKQFQVDSVQISEQGTIKLSLIEYTSSIYAYDPANEEREYPDTNLPDPFSIDAPASVSASNVSALLDDGTLLPRMSVTWDAVADAFVSEYEIRYKLSTNTAYEYTRARGTSALIEGISTGTYNYGIRAINSIGAKSSWVDGTNVDLTKDTTKPNDITSFTATAGARQVTLSWTNPADVDYKQTRIYQNTSNSAPASHSYVVSGDTFVVTGLTPDQDYYFWVENEDYAGNIAKNKTASGVVTPYKIDLANENNSSGWVDADGAAAAAPVKSVAGLTGSVLVADIITEGALIVSGDNISDLTNDAGYTTFDANDVEAAIANNVTVIDGAKITTGTVAAARLDVAGLINTQKLAVNYELDLNSSGVKTVTITDYSISVNGANGWDTDVYSTQSYKGKCIARGTIKVKNAYYMFGINTDPLANDSYSSLDFSVYCDYGTLRIYESGTDRGTFGSLAIGDTLEVIYADGYVKYYQNGTEKRSVAVSGDPEFYFDSSFYSGGNVVYVEDVYFGQGGVAITPDAIYQGAGHWNNADTGFYLDKDGRFSLDNKLSFDPSSDTLRVDGLIEAVNLTVTGEAKFANVTADNVKVGSITYDMLSGEVKNAFQADIAVSTGGTPGDFQEDSGIIPSTVDLPVFSHGSKPVEITLTASKTGYHYVDYTTAQRTATYTVQRATDAAFTANLQTIGTGSIIVSAYDISGYYGGSSTVFYHAVNFSVLITDDPSLGNYYYRVTFSAGSAFSDTNIQVTANLAANEAASGVTSSGGNADTLDNLDSTKFMRTDENTGTTGNLQVGGNLDVTGDLNITGNINSYNVTDLDVTDTSITLNAGGAALTANGAGIYIEKAVDANTDASLTWNATSDEFVASHGLQVGGRLYFDQNPVGTTYGSGASAVPTYYIHQKVGDNDGWRLYGEAPSTNDVKMIFEIVDDIEGGDTWVFRNKKTYGDYAATEPFKITGEGNIIATGTISASGYNKSNWDTAYTDTSGATNANTASAIVKRDASGNFSAGTITATLSGNATSATSAGKWTTARTLTVGGTGKSVDGSGNVSWSLSEIGAPARSSSEGSIVSLDTRSVNYSPSDRDKGFYADFKQRTTIGLPNSGNYAGLLTFRPYGSGTDMSGGKPTQIATLEDGRSLFMRAGADASSWTPWWRIVREGADQYFPTDASWAANGSTTGMVVIKLPSNLNAYDMVNIEISVYEYDSTNASKIIIGGHNWNTTGLGWYNYGVKVIGEFNKPIYLGSNTSTSERYIMLGSTGSSWSYGSVHVTKVTTSSFYSAMDWTLPWSVYQTTSTVYTNISADLNSTTSKTLSTNGYVNSHGYALGGNYVIDNLARGAFGNSTNQYGFNSTQSAAGWYSGIKMYRGTGDWSTTANNNFGMLVTDTGWEVNKFTSPSRDNVTGRSVLFYIDGNGNAVHNGNLGIGAAPSHPLHISKSYDVYSGLIHNTNTATTSYNVVRLTHAASAATGYFGTAGSAAGNVSFRNSFVIGTQNASDFVINTNDAERGRINSVGLLTLNTTNFAVDSVGRIAVGHGNSTTYMAGTSGTSIYHANYPALGLARGSSSRALLYMPNDTKVRLWIENNDIADFANAGIDLYRGVNVTGGGITARAANVVIDAQSSADSQFVGFRAGYQANANLAGTFKYSTADAQLYIDNLYQGNNGNYSNINFRNCPNGSTSLQTRLIIHGSSGLVDAANGFGVNGKQIIGSTGGYASYEDGRITMPSGAHYTTSASSVTGAIKIRLPQLKSNTMMRMTVKVYEYNGGSNGSSFTLELGGYNYGTGGWYNVFANIIGDTSHDMRMAVRFGDDGSSSCIWINETSKTWVYPQVFVTEFQGGFSNYQNTKWINSWATSFETSFGYVNQTISANQIGKDVKSRFYPKQGLSVVYTGNAESDSGIYVNNDSSDWGIIIEKPGNDYGIDARVSSGAGYAWSCLGSGTRTSRITGGGTAIFNGDVTAFGSASDIRLKTDIEPITDAVNKVKQLNGVTFEYKKEGKRSTGLIAQDVQKVLPEAVYENEGLNEDDEKYLALRYGTMVGLLVEAIKEQQDQIDELKQIIEELKNGN